MSKTEEIRLEVMKQINLLFPLSKEPIAITSAIELTIQQTLQEVDKIIDNLNIRDIIYNNNEEYADMEIKRELKSSIIGSEERK